MVKFFKNCAYGILSTIFFIHVLDPTNQVTYEQFQFKETANFRLLSKNVVLKPHTHDRSTQL